MCIDIYVERRWIPGTLGNPPRIDRFLKNATYRRPILRFDKLLGAPRQYWGCTDGPPSSGGAGGQGHPDGVSCGSWFYSTCLFQDTVFLANQNAGLTSSICARVCLVLWNTCSILMWQICSSERWVSVGDIEVSSLNFRVTIFQRRYRFFSSTLREIMSNYVQRRSNM